MKVSEDQLVHEAAFQEESLKRPSLIQRPSINAVGRRGSQVLLVQIAAREAGSKPLTAARLQDFISEIGMGYFQYITVCLMGIVMLSEGAVMLSISCLAPVMKTKWKLSNLQSGSLPALAFAGLAKGTSSSGALSDLCGRRTAILISYLCVVMAGGLSSMAAGYTSMAILNFLQGLACGLGVPAAMSMVSEITPLKYRPVMFICLTSFFTLGELYLCTGLLIWMPDLQDPEHWKRIVLWAIAPASLMLFVSVAFMHESANWLCVQGRIREAKIVLRQMARMNGKTEVLTKLDLSNDNAEADGDDAPTEDIPTTGLRTLLKLILNFDVLVKLFLFAILCVAGNIATFGMSSYWPIAMKRVTGPSDAINAARDLMMLRSLGIPCALFTVALAALPFVPHKAIILTSAVVGSSGLFCMAFASSSTALIVAGAILTTFAGSTFHQTSLLFANESFVTQIRSTATAIAITLGRLGSILSPVLIQAAGQNAFLITAATIFILTVPATLILKETKGKDIEDFMEGEGGEETPVAPQPVTQMLQNLETVREVDSGDDGSEIFDPAAEDSEQASRANAEDSWFFSKGTVGARLEMFLLVSWLGVVSGVAVSFYLSSVGYFAAKMQDKGFFIYQLLVVFSSPMPVLLMRYYFDARFDEMFGTQNTMLFRIGVASLFLSLVCLVLPFIEGTAAVLTAGFFAGAMSTAIFGSGMELAVAVSSTAAPWLQSGTALGAALPILFVPLIGYSPGAGLATRAVFFTVPTIICIAGTAVYWHYHLQVVRLIEFMSVQDGHAQRRKFSSRHTLSNLRNVVRGSSRSEEEPLAASTGGTEREEMQEATSNAWEWIVFALSLFNIAINMASGFFLAALFPAFGTPLDVQNLYLYKVAGDLIGRCSASAWWSKGIAEGTRPQSFGTSNEHVNVSMFVSLFVCTFLRLAATLVLALPVVVQGPRSGWEASSEAVVWGTFCIYTIGAFVNSSLEAVLPSIVAPSQRRSAVYKQTAAHFLGILLGLCAAGICHVALLSKTAPMQSASLIERSLDGVWLRPARHISHKVRKAATHALTALIADGAQLQFMRKE